MSTLDPPRPEAEVEALGSVRPPLKLLVLDAERHILAADPRIGELLDVDCEQLVGRPLESLFAARDRQGQAAYLEQVVRHTAGWVDVSIELQARTAVRMVRLRLQRRGERWHAFVEALGRPGDPIFALHLDRQRWHSVAASSHDGICILDEIGTILEHNARFLDLMRFTSSHGVHLSRDSLIGRNLFDLDGIRLGRLQSVFTAQEPRSREFHDTIRYKDRWLYVELRPTFVKRDYAGCCLVIRDRTAEEELIRLRTDQARLAGMSSVASSVLHNVGNAINGVNVSVARLAGEIRNSKLDRLAAVAEILAAAEDPVRFLTEDERGRALPSYLCRLGDALRREHAEQQATLDKLREQLHHVCSVISQQQTLAQPVATEELVDIEGIADTAIEIGLAGRNDRRFAVSCDIEPMPCLRLDRHLVIAVLVNLVRNAADAVAALDQGEILLRARLCGDVLRVEVTDNGSGIAPADRDRIFSYGFTTKRDGNGIGLHSCANLARTLGGSLHCESDGPGQGATFTVELPVRLQGGARPTAGSKPAPAAAVRGVR